MIWINKLLYTEMNVFALVVLVIIYLNIRRHAQRHMTEQKLFLALLYSNALILVLDSLMWMMDGVGGAGLTHVYRAVTAFYYAMNPIICLIWSSYADYLIYRNGRRLKRFVIPICIPAAVNLVLSTLSIFTRWMFTISDQNVYHRGPLFLLMAAISYFYLFFSFLEILLKQNRIQKQYYFPILAFAVPPFIGGVFQTLFYGLSLIWVCMTVSVLIVFINIQADQLNTDFLTGLYNRRQLDNYLKRLKTTKKQKLLGGMMIDLTQFKVINDAYGHDEGDKALQQVAKVLQQTFRIKDFIARMGGDEFIVLMEVEDREDLEAVVNRLLDNMARFNEQKQLPYEIHLSIGYDCYNVLVQHDFMEFIRHIDRLMYKNKQEKDEQLRRA